MNAETDLCGFNSLTPAKARIQPSAVLDADEWVPASAGAMV
jgi:hypothetical protein